MEEDTSQSPIQRTTQPRVIKPKNLPLVLFTLLLIILFLIATCFVVHKYVLSKKLPAITTFEDCAKASGSMLQTMYPAICVTRDGRRFTQPLMEEEQKNLLPPDETTNWKRYDSTIGISFLKPEDVGVAEPSLDASISIEPKNNTRENQEITDGWVIGVTYNPNQVAPDPSKNRAEELKLYEEGNGCTTTPITTSLIGGKTAYNFYVTNCFHFNSSRYFVSSNSTYYEINAEYVGNIEKYKNTTEEIINSINFTK